MILDYSNKWNTGDIITVKFLNGTARLHDRVIEVLKEWEDLTNIKFRVNDTGPSSVRVKFNNGRNDSSIGTDALTVQDDIETVSFNIIHADSAKDELRQVVLHEFGHVLGLVHEHSHPDCDIEFNIAAANRYFKSVYGFSEADVERNLFRKYLHNQVRCPAFDEKSIMMYNIPPECTKNNKEYMEATDLSTLDRSFIPLLYPENEDEPEVILPDNEFEFTISAEEKEKLFKIETAEKERYTFKVKSDQNVGLSVFCFDKEGEKNGYINFYKFSDFGMNTLGKDTAIQLTEYNTIERPIVNEYYLRVNLFDSDSSSGVIKVIAE